MVNLRQKDSTSTFYGINKSVTTGTSSTSSPLMKTFFTGLDLIQRCSDPLTGYPQEAEGPKAANTRKNRENVNEQLFVATERNAKLRYEGYKKLSEM